MSLPPDEHLVAVYAQTGDLHGKFWFLDHDLGDKYTKGGTAGKDTSL